MNDRPTDEQIKDLIRDLISSKAIVQQMQQYPPPAFLEQKERQIDALRELLEFREAKRRPFKSFCRGSICHGHGDYAVCGSLYRGEYFQCGDCKAKDLESQQNNLAESVADLVISRLDERDAAKVKNEMIINNHFHEEMRELNSGIAKHPKIIAESDRLPPHLFRELVNELRDIAIKYHGTRQLRERIAHALRGAMLNGGKS